MAATAPAAAEDRTAPPKLKRTGGPYADARRPFGDFIGFRTAGVGTRWWPRRTALVVPDEGIAR